MALQGTVNSVRINPNRVKLDIDADLDKNQQQDNYKLDVQQRSDVSTNTDDPQTSDVKHTIEGEESTTLSQPTAETKETALGIARQREAFARAHFLNQAGISEDNITGYSYQRNEDGSTTERFEGQFDGKGGIDSATFQSQVQQQTNGDDVTTRIENRGTVTYTGLTEEEAKAAELDVTVDPLVHPNDITQTEEPGETEETEGRITAPNAGEPLELNETQEASYAKNIYVKNDTAVGPGVQGAAVEQHQSQVRDNLIQMGISEENASALLGGHGPNNDGVDGFYGPKTEQATQFEQQLRSYNNAGIQLNNDKLNEAISAEDFNPESFDPSKFVQSYGERRPGDEIQLEDGSTVTVPSNNRRNIRVESPLETSRTQVEEPEVETEAETELQIPQKLQAEYDRIKSLAAPYINGGGGHRGRNLRNKLRQLEQQISPEGLAKLYEELTEKRDTLRSEVAPYINGGGGHRGRNLRNQLKMVEEQLMQLRPEAE